MNEHARGNRWLDIGLVCVLLILYAWLRSWSGLWQYRWTGLVMGIALALYAQRGRQASYNIAKRYDIPRRVYLVGALVFIALGTVTLRRFFLTGNSNDGFLGVIALAFSIEEAFVYRSLSRKDTEEPLIGDQKPTMNHG